MILGIENNTIILLLVAVMNAVTLFYTRRTEKNTNSMKDALVKSTGEVAHQLGRNEAIKEAEVKAATLAEGVLQGRSDETKENKP